ncbi:MAG: leucine-rich repeat domain-containing protein [Oscillospiraceae bacterium]|nr:leucine-rich repeat domain-containing protein [Oscillospiraceae bacterium]
METKDVFISYKAEEFDDANWVKSILEANGISCWMAPMSITGGSSYAAEIPQAIRGCKAFVLILSEKAQLSKWVPRELDQAINGNKIVMPFMLENCALKDDFNFYLSNVQRYAAYENKSAAMEKMIREIKAIIGINNTEPVPNAEEAPENGEEKIKTEAATAKREKSHKKSQKPVKKHDSSKKGKRTCILGIVAAAVIFLICAVTLIIKMSYVNIAGEKIKKSAYSIRIENVELTEKDINNFSKLKNPDWIELKNCTLPDVDMDFLSFPELGILRLSDCELSEKQLKSIDYAALTRLYNLDLSGNKALNSLDELSEVADTLQKLNISNTSVSDVDMLSEFSQLTELYADNNSIKSIDSLASCPALSIVSLNGNGIDDLMPLSACTRLKTLCVNGNKLSSLEGLENCIELEEIQAGSNGITTIDALKNTTLLRFVFLNDNQIDNISVLAKSSENLRNLYLKNNLVSDIGALSGCATLTYLNIDNNLVESLQPLSGCTQLKGLSAENNLIGSISGMEGKDNLTYLDLAANPLRETSKDGTISFDESEKATVDLSETDIRGINLKTASGYKYLNLHGAIIDNYDVLYAANGYGLILDYSDGIDFTALSDCEYSAVKIVDCPLDKQVEVKGKLGEYRTEFVASSDIVNLTEQYVPEGIKGVVEYY